MTNPEIAAVRRGTARAVKNFDGDVAYRNLITALLPAAAILLAAAAVLSRLLAA